LVPAILLFLFRRGQAWGIGAESVFSTDQMKNSLAKAIETIFVRSVPSRPIAERDAIDHEREIYGYYEQKNISKKNLKRLNALSKSSDFGIAALAEAVLAVGRAKPHRRKRLSFLARNHPEVMDKLGAVGLIIPPDEYRAMWSIEDDNEWYQRDLIPFQRAMDDLLLSDPNSIDPGEIGRLLFEYSEMVKSET